MPIWLDVCLFFAASGPLVEATLHKKVADLWLMFPVFQVQLQALIIRVHLVYG